MDYLSGWCANDARLEGKTVIVTGANSGIGKETALQLYRRGARVIMACRNTSQADLVKTEMEETSMTYPTGSLAVHRLDLASFRSTREFVNTIGASEEYVNILVNNAGVMAYPQAKTEDGFEMHMGTNHFGHALLTLLLLPTLVKSAPSRIIFVSSKVHEYFPLDLEDINFEKKPYNALEAYCRSKSANILFSRKLADMLKANNIRNVTTYSLHPGVVRTELGRHFDRTVWPGATWAWHHLLSWFLKSPLCGAQTTLYCALDPALADQSGLYYSDCVVKSSSIETQCQDSANKLWEETLKAVNIDNSQIWSEC